MKRMYGIFPALLSGFVLLLVQPGATVLAGRRAESAPGIARTAGTLGPTGNARPFPKFRK